MYDRPAIICDNNPGFCTEPVSAVVEPPTALPPNGFGCLVASSTSLGASLMALPT